jgi:hypothetical protein
MVLVKMRRRVGHVVKADVYFPLVVAARRERGASALLAASLVDIREPATGRRAEIVFAAISEFGLSIFNLQTFP